MNEDVSLVPAVFGRKDVLAVESAKKNFLRFEDSRISQIIFYSRRERATVGVVWKSVTEGLHPNIWEKQHMDKIIPSILYNLQDEEGSGLEYDVN